MHLVQLSAFSMSALQLKEEKKPFLTTATYTCTHTYRALGPFLKNPVDFSRNSNYRRTMKSILLIKKILGLVEMTWG